MIRESWISKSKKKKKKIVFFFDKSTVNREDLNLKRKIKFDKISDKCVEPWGESWISKFKKKTLLWENFLISEVNHAYLN